MRKICRLRTKHKPRLLFAMMGALASGDAAISFEGRLAHTDLAKIDGVRLDETEVLRRQTLQPRMDFLVLPLTPASLPVIERAVNSKIAFNGCAGIVHVQIESHGQIAFAAYDEFAPDCVVAHSAVPMTLLEELVEKRILYSCSVGQLT
jgi:hypothetical protein